ncbi:PWWP domain [Trypanosoma melophagium]|uniref:PWWP domain n=1 Tax=Trypanosoma melophagium TaxID=715481 RepID=UPI003519FE0F|nr:PWWP domain [Trypanosoma melophagium]
MTSPLALNTLVWLKQPGYPWWPGMVLDPSAIEVEIPAGYDTCVLCLPSVASSVAFANSSNNEEILLFNPDTDKELLEAGRQDTDCAAAVEEAVRVYEQQQGQKQLLMPEKDSEKVMDKKSENEEGMEARVHKKHSQIKLEKSDKKRHKKHERDEKSFSEKGERHHQHRKRRSEKHRKKERKGKMDDDDDDNSEKEYNSSDEDSLNSYGDEEKVKHSGKKTRKRVEFDTDEQYEREALLEPIHQEDDAAYFERCLRENRQHASDGSLERFREQLTSLAAACRRGSVVSVSEAAEEQILDALSPMTTIDVTFDQLRRTKIGVVVGRFLSRDYPVRVVMLASAILTYWFRQLPPATQQQLRAQTTLELASNDTTVGSDREGIALGAVGVQLEATFTDEEVNETATEPSTIARQIESELAAVDDEDVSMAVLAVLRDGHNADLRRGLLDGSIGAKELVANAVDPRRLLLRLRGPGGESTTPEPESPLGDGSALENFTTRYACPGCGAREAVVNEYSVQAHDNMAAFVRCLKCGETWNVEA